MAVRYWDPRIPCTNADVWQLIAPTRSLPGMMIDFSRAMSLWHIVRTGARTWRRTPALAAVIVCTLALGIGATTSAFTIAYSILVQRFPFPGADRLVWITTSD